jgi:hypothetical protein
MALVAPDPDTIRASSLLRSRNALADMQDYHDLESGYAKQQSTRPQTLGYGLADSPAGQAAWILEKFRAWTDCGEGAARHPGECAVTRDELLDNVMMYWLTDSAASSARLYWESLATRRTWIRSTMPVGIEHLPDARSCAPSRRWAREGASVPAGALE